MEKAMTFVTTLPEMMAAAAGDLETIGAAVAAGNAAATAPTVGVLPAASDQVSALTATQFAAHALDYQAISTQAAAIHESFVRTLGASAGLYAVTEAVNAAATG
jgi:PE family